MIESMDVRDQRSSLGVVPLFTQIQKAFNRRIDEGVLGMRFKPYMTLCFIRDHPGTSQQDLESALFVDANTVVLILNELESGQLSIRRRDPNDRRRHVVEITPAGRRALERGDRAREELEDELLRGLSADEKKTLRRLLERVLDGLHAEAKAEAKA